MNALSSYKQLGPWLMLTACLLLAGCEQKEFAPDQLTLGAPFPDIGVTTLAGKPVSLSSLRGRVVLLNVWATWCPPCRRELPSLEKLEQILKEQPFSVVGLSIDDDVDLVQEYLSDQGVTYANYVDLSGKEANEKLGIVAYPHTFLIGKKGRLVARYAGERVWHMRSMVNELREEINRVD
ncbi:hypothetical protein MNBD_GAMMA16-603 [hydrothermal vent metagenome]|uniref:Thioredoxin domain-containing protein n=1 Tax=hydrothermal vent metagenome TaxID=652676 RepID=A0A3B0ZI83_9ZZZZ